MDIEQLYQFGQKIIITNYILVLPIFLILFGIYYYFIDKPKEIIKTYEPDDNETVGRRSEESPPTFPNGWLPLIESRKLSKGQVISVFRVGQDLAIYRGQSGKVYVLDAFCPHAGAHLGYGGTVVNDSIKCPFHAWIFNGTGQCTHVPGLPDKNIPKAEIKVWNSVEINGFVYVWNHINGDQPDWFVEENPILTNMSYRGKVDVTFNCHIQEIHENATDLMHFDTLHAPGIYGNPILNYFKSLMYYDFDCTFAECPEPNRHQADLVLTSNIILFGKLQLFQGKFLIRISGHTIFDSKLYMTFFGHTINFHIMQGLINLGPLRTQMVSHLYGENTFMNKVFSKIVLAIWLDQADRDIYVWNRKKFMRNPMFAKNEVYLKKFRRWSKQFYSGDFKKSDNDNN